MLRAQQKPRGPLLPLQIGYTYASHGAKASSSPDTLAVSTKYGCQTYSPHHHAGCGTFELSL